MVDENDTDASAQPTEVAAPITAPEPKKARAKRRTPAELALVAAAKAQKPGRGKKAALAETGKPTIASKPVSAKAPAKTVAFVNPPLSQTSAATVDDFADLLQLEEENSHLRKALSDKLRAENADLRKRLGHE